jgi:hypothetical protein
MGRRISEGLTCRSAIARRELGPETAGCIPGMPLQFDVNLRVSFMLDTGECILGARQVGEKHGRAVDPSACFRLMPESVSYCQTLAEWKAWQAT